MTFFVRTIGTVKRSAELARVKALPRRDAPSPGTEALSSVLALGDMTLWPDQAWALADLCERGGLLGGVGVGGGKTLISLLAPLLVRSERPLLLVPAKLVDKTHRDFTELRPLWRHGVVPKVLSYQLIGHPAHREDVEAYAPDLIIADEAHRLANPRAACTRRVGRYMDTRPGTVFAALSGTMTRRQLKDVVHIAEWSLGTGSPFPTTLEALDEWGRALDADGEWRDGRMRPGPLVDLGAGRNAREAFQDRLRSTPGVVMSSDTAVTASIQIDEWQAPPAPPAVREALAGLSDEWVLPNGVELTEAVDVWRHAREMSLGFWYRWEPAPPDWWLEPRRAWGAFVRETLKHSRHLDSPAEVAAEYSDAPEWLAWKEVEHRYTYDLVEEWLTRDYIDAAEAWAERTRGIVWTGHVAVGRAMSIPYYAEMGLWGNRSIDDDRRGGYAASIAANSEGRNLQHLHRNLVLSPPTTGTAWEQLLGRTHRPGQTRTVEVEVHLGTDQDRNGFWRAVADAEYQRAVTGAPQKLLLSDITIKENP